MGTAILTRANLGRAERERATAAAPIAATLSPDGILERLVKLVPSEVLTAYAASTSVVTNDVARIATFFAGIGLTLLFLSQPVRLGNGLSVRAPRAQYLLSTIAFALWATLYNHPLAPWIPLKGEAVLLAVSFFTVAAPLLVRE